MEHKIYFKKVIIKITKFVNALGIEYVPQNMQLFI